jgi:signal transduction histidine kinase
VRRTSSIATLLSLVTGTQLVVLVMVFAVAAANAWVRERQSAQIAYIARVSRDIVLVREALRGEVGVIDTTMAEPAIAGPATLVRLKLLHQHSLDAVSYVERQIAQAHDEQMPPELVQRLTRTMADFDRRLFPAVLAAANLPRAQRPPNLLILPQTSAYSVLDLVDMQAAILSRQIAVTGAYMSETMRISDIAWHVRVEAGQERRFLANFIAWPHKPSLEELGHLAEVKGRTDAPWQSIEQAVKGDQMPPALLSAIDHANRDYFGHYADLRAQILKRLDNGLPPGITGPEWLKLTTPALNSLMQVSRAALRAAEDHALRNLVEAQHDFRIAMMFMGICIWLAMVTVFLVFVRLLHPLKQITRAFSSSQQTDIAKALALSERGDEMGECALALESFCQAAADRQRLESELLQNMVARQAAEAASKVKSEFLANMSHELRTPLNAVLGFSEMMLHQTLGPLSERYQEYAKLINDSGGHLLSLVSDILDLAKIEAGRFQGDFREIDLKACVEDCVPLVVPRAQEHGITIATQLPPAGVTVVADARACKQILINLLSNAVKFSRPQGTITVLLKQAGESVLLSVRDEGVGIPAEVLERIGQPFEQASNNPMLAREGTGLGLSLVKALVNEHGGTMTVDSREDVGTTVSVTLPRTQESRKAA